MVFNRELSPLCPKDWREAMYYRYWADSRERPSHYGVRTKRHKLIFYDGLVRSGREAEECWELYDLEEDPRELVNVYDAAENQGVIEELKEQLRRLRVEFGDDDELV